MKTTAEQSWEAIIWVGLVLFGLIVLSLIGICLWSLARTLAGATGVSTRSGFDIPGDDVIGTDAEPLGWTALDDLQLHRLLEGPF